MSERKRDVLWLVLWTTLFVAAWPLDGVRFMVAALATIGLYLIGVSQGHADRDKREDEHDD